MHRYRVHDLLTFANRYLVQFTKFPAEASSVKGITELFPFFFLFENIVGSFQPCYYYYYYYYSYYNVAPR